jgi:hypothetical protein
VATEADPVLRGAPLQDVSLTVEVLLPGEVLFPVSEFNGDHLACMGP